MECVDENRHTSLAPRKGDSDGLSLIRHVSHRSNEFYPRKGGESYVAQTTRRPTVIVRVCIRVHSGRRRLHHRGCQWSLRLARPQARLLHSRLSLPVPAPILVVRIRRVEWAGMRKSHEPGGMPGPGGLRVAIDQIITGAGGIRMQLGRPQGEGDLAHSTVKTVAGVHWTQETLRVRNRQPKH